MSFTFNWNAFAKQEAFQTQIHELLTSTLNKKKPRILEDNITVLNLDWGNEPPTLEMLEIGDVALDRFRGVFKLNYTGGATITVATKVQANPLNVYASGTPAPFTMPSFVQAPVSFPIPLHLTLRNIRLQGTVIVVFSKSGGLTLVFRNDPLQSIEVSSTFDRFASLASFLQQQIETQIRGLFREEVPALLYQLSLKYLPSNYQVPLGPNHRPDDLNSNRVAFAEIDSEKPVSLVNILHISAMLSSRRTLAIETPIMPTAIVRSEIHHRALLSRLKSQSFSFGTDFYGAHDPSYYDQLYTAVKHMTLRNNPQRQPKRRVVRLRKKRESKDAEEMESSQPLWDSETAQNSAHSIETKYLHPEVTPRYSDSKPGENCGLLNGPLGGSHGVSAGGETRYISRVSPQATIVTSKLSSKKLPFSVGYRIPVRPFVRDTKCLPTFSIRGPQHYVLPQAVVPTEIWFMPMHEDVDESPPAYVA